MRTFEMSSRLLVMCGAVIVLALGVRTEAMGQGTSSSSSSSSEQPEAGTATDAAKPEASETDTKAILPIPDYSGTLKDREYLTGEWKGLRPKLADLGIQFDVNWTQTLQSIVTGGVDTGAEYGGSLDYKLNLDLYRMGLVPGGLLTIRAQTRYGESVNGNSGLISPVDTDGFFPLSADDIPITISDLLYTQFFSDKFALFIGKFDTLSGDLNPFASGRGTQQFMNQNFVFNSVAILSVPYSTLGFGMVIQPTKNIKISSTIMSTADSSTTTGFQNLGDGWTWSTEANFQYELASLRGGQNVTFILAGDNEYFNIGERFSFQPGVGFVAPTENTTWAATWSGWQYLYMQEKPAGPIDLGNGPPSVKGLGLFARLGFADKDTNPIEFSFSGGIGGQGMIPGRDNDRFGVGYFYTSIETGRLASLTGIENHSQGFEAYYNIAFTPATELTLDVQVVDGVNPTVDTAVILGARLRLNF